MVSEFTDLIEYLVSLKQPQSASLVQNGMPNEIPSTPHPIRLELSRMTHSSSSTQFGSGLFQAKAPVLGDFQSQRIWGLRQEAGKLRQIRQLTVAPQRVVSFGRDWSGELYVVGYEGTIYGIHFEGLAFE